MQQRVINLSISGMTCDSCAKSVEKTLDGIDGILARSVNFPNMQGSVTFDADTISKEQIISAINATGQYEVAGGSTQGRVSNGDYDLITIGGGSAAFAAAIKASELGRTVLMINDGLPIGGTCVNVGCVPSKTLIRAAEAFHRANHPSFDGIKAGNNRISFPEVIKQKRELVDDLRQQKYVDVIKDDANITVVGGHAKFRNKSTIEVNGSIRRADVILIATGSSTFIPSIPGLRESGYHTNDTIYELEELPEHLVILGGRYIALENAQMFVRLGSNVTILQKSTRILSSEMPDLTDALTGYLLEEGIAIQTGVQIKSISRRSRRILLKLNSRDGVESIDATHLMLGTGREGNTRGLGLEELGVEMHGNGFIKTDEHQQTSIPGIYAAGDVTGDHLFVYTAAYAGALAMENAFAGEDTRKDYSVLPWVIFTDPQVAGVGMDETQAKEAGIGYETSVLPVKDIPRAIAARNTRGFIKLIRSTENDKLIGARILASEGSELLMEISMAMKYGVTVRELRQMFHPYLTLSEGVKLAAIAFDKDVHKLSCCAS